MWSYLVEKLGMKIIPAKEARGARGTYNMLGKLSAVGTARDSL